MGTILTSIANKNMDKKYTSFEACLYGMQSLFDNDPKVELLNGTILKDLSKESSLFKVDYIHLIKQVNKYECDVFTKDSKGVRRYLVSLEKNTKFKYLYRILDVKEKKVDSRYQI